MNKFLWSQVVDFLRYSHIYQAPQSPPTSIVWAPQSPPTTIYGERASPVAVVGCRPDGEHTLAEVPLVAFHHKLVGTTDHVNVVCRVELREGGEGKGVGGRSVREGEREGGGRREERGGREEEGGREGGKRREGGREGGGRREERRGREGTHSRDNVTSKEVSCSAWADAPPFNIYRGEGKGGTSEKESGFRGQAATDLRDRTRAGHTWARRGALPASCQ